jgi:hypothetical protein
MPAGIGYPLHRAVLDIAAERDNGTSTRVRAGAEDKIDAVVIPCVLALILFMLFTIPLFIRKYIVRPLLDDTLLHILTIRNSFRDICPSNAGPGRRWT